VQDRHNLKEKDMEEENIKTDLEGRRSENLKRLVEG
jgi:hypothetical protein